MDTTATAILAGEAHPPGYDDYSHIIGAALLPFARCPRTGICFFLLAREREFPTWHGANLWTHFGGTRRRSESAEQCAAREFIEESLGMVRYHSRDDTMPLSVAKDAQGIASSLVRGEYAYKYVHLQDGMPRYVVFVREIPWDASCVLRFRSVRSIMLRLNTTYRTLDRAGRAELVAHPAVFLERTRTGVAPGAETSIWVGAKNTHLEKRCLGWWSLSQVRAMVHSEGDALRPPDARHGTHTCAPGLLQVFGRLLHHYQFTRPQAADHHLTDDPIAAADKPPHLLRVRYSQQHLLSVLEKQQQEQDQHDGVSTADAGSGVGSHGRPDRSPVGHAPPTVPESEVPARGD